MISRPALLSGLVLAAPLTLTHAQDVVCGPGYNVLSDDVQGHVSVPAGSYCALLGNQVTGDVTVEPGGAVALFDAAVLGDLNVNGAVEQLDVGLGLLLAVYVTESLVAGTIHIEGSGNSIVIASVSTGVELVNNDPTDGLAVIRNTMCGSISATGNVGGPIGYYLGSNAICGDLVVTDNATGGDLFVYSNFLSGTATAENNDPAALLTAIVENDDSFCAGCPTEGCTPGYWKQPQHADSYPVGLTPDTPFGDVFVDVFPGMTFVQVLGQGGGGLNALGRHAAAAYLNASTNGEVQFGISAQQVVNLFNDAVSDPDANLEALKDFFNVLNENGCPLN